MDIEDGWIDHRVSRGLPGLGLRYATVDCAPDLVAPDLRASVLEQSRKFTGARFFEIRRDPLVGAYRALFRQIGLDPDVQPTPIEQLGRDRIMRGTFLSTTRLADALMIAMIHTRVPVFAWNAERVSGPLGIRLDGDDELVIADAEHSLSALFGEVDDSFAVGPRTQAAVVFTIGAPGVPVHLLDDALWQVGQMLPTLQ